MLWSASSRAPLARLLADRRGVTAVEFGFVGLVFFTMLLGAVDLGRFQITQQSLRSIAAEAARVALIAADKALAANPTGTPANACVTLPSGASLRTSVTTPTNLTPFLAPGSLTLAPSCVVSASGVRTVTVTASYPFQFVAPLLSVGLASLTTSAALSY